MYYSEDLIEDIRLRNDIIDVIGSYVELKKKGRNYFGLCPFHNEKSPSFSVDPSKQIYHCFGCGESGNVYTFLMAYEHMTFPEAVQFLAKRAGVTLPEKPMGREEKQRLSEKDAMLSAHKAAAVYYFQCLFSEKGAQGRKYLKEARGLSDETIKSFGLGFAPKSSGNLVDYLRRQGYSDGLLVKSGLARKDDRYGLMDKFWNRVMFPIMDPGSHVIGFGGRVMGEGKPKYLNSPETLIFDKSRNLYGLHIARRTREKYFILCEGYMDVIALHSAGFTNAVASLGTAFTEGHAFLMARYVRDVYMTFDSDGAGKKAALRAAPILKDAGLVPRVIRLSPYKDPDEFIRAEGAEAFRERIREAESSFLFAVRCKEEDYDMQSPEGRTDFFNAVALMLSVFDEEIERDNYMQAVAEMYQIPYESLKKLVVRRAVEEGQARRYKRPESVLEKDTETQKDDGFLAAQRYLITWLIEDDTAYDQIKDIIRPEDFTYALYGEVVEKIYAQRRAGENNPARIISLYSADEKGSEVAAIFNAHLTDVEEKSKKEKAIKETILRMKRDTVNKKSRDVCEGDMAALKQLIEEKKMLESGRKLSIKISIATSGDN